MAAKAEAAKREYLTYKGKPLVRRGDKIYYGDLSGKYIIVFTVKTEKEVGGTKIADDISIELMTNTGRDKERAMKKAERKGLYAAMDIAEFWLEDALENG